MGYILLLIPSGDQRPIAYRRKTSIDRLIERGAFLEGRVLVQAIFHLILKPMRKILSDIDKTDLTMLLVDNCRTF